MLFFSVLCLSGASAQEDAGTTLWHYDKERAEWVRVVPPVKDGVNVIRFGKKEDNAKNKVINKDIDNRQKAAGKSMDSPTTTYSKPRISQGRSVTGVSSSPVFSLRTNALYDIALAPNLGFEFALGRDWSVGADLWLAWLHNKDNDMWWENYGFTLHGRYWFGERHNALELSGWHTGIYAGTFTYDVWADGKGYQSPDMFKTFNVGVEIGWSTSIGGNWRLDIYGGTGLLHTRQIVYDHNFGGGFYAKSHRHRNLVDLTRFGVTFSYIFK